MVQPTPDDSIHICTPNMTDFLNIDKRVQISGCGSLSGMMENYVIGWYIYKPSGSEARSRPNDIFVRNSDKRLLTQPAASGLLPL